MSNVLITGSARGIGLELCRLYARRGAKVWAVCRGVSAELAGLGVTVLDGVELTQPNDLAKLAATLKGHSFELAILNAGILNADSLENLDTEADHIRKQFEVNALAPLLLAETLLPCLKPGSKLAMTTSRMGSMADNASGGYYGYRMSKAALNMAGVSLAVDLKPRGISVFLVHPGYVQTDMTGGRGDSTPAQSAERIGQLLDRLGPSDSGTFWHANGTPLPW